MAKWSEYISVDTFFKALAEHSYPIVLGKNGCPSMEYGMTNYGLMQLVEELPAADVTEVIRCPDCVHIHDDDCPLVGWGRCGDHYCSYAERRSR